MHEKGFDNRYFVSKYCHKTHLAPLLTAYGLELCDFSKCRRLRTSVETGGSLLKGMPAAPDRKEDRQLALERFPDDLDIVPHWLCVIFPLFPCPVMKV